MGICTALARVRLTHSQWDTVPEKALATSGADRFTRGGGTCRLHAIFMNQLCIIWRYQEELSSTAARPRADGKACIATLVRCRASDPKTASRSSPIGAVARLLGESEIKPRPRIALGVHARKSSTAVAKVTMHSQRCAFFGMQRLDP
jgi:hypothetical protein